MKFASFSLVVLLSIFSIGFSGQFNPSKVVYAVDCGNTESYKSALGFQYRADNGYSPNTKVADYSINPEASSATMKYTKDSAVYMTERHADDTFYYDIPLKSPGKYVLISNFAEMWFADRGKRVFDIRMGDCVGQSQVDIFSEVGKYAAYDSYVEFTMQGDSVFINGKACNGAIQNGKLRVHYTKIGIDNPKVDGIILYKGGLEETDFAEIPQMRRDWERKQIDERRKKEEERMKKEESQIKRKEKKKIRNDDYDDYAEDYEDIENMATGSKSILGYLQDYLGLVVVGVVGYFLINFLAGKSEQDPELFLEERSPSPSKGDHSHEGGKSKKESKKKR